MFKLERCAFCGARNCEAHKKYVDRCDECGKRYHRYSCYKSQQKKDPTDKRAAKLDQIVEEYRDLKRFGYKVPRDIE